MNILKSMIDFVGSRVAERRVSALHAFVQPGEKVLDIGSGGGWVAQLLCKKGARVTLLDVVDLNQTPLPLVVYDGNRIPFPDKSFDVSLLLFVLHHCQNPLQVLKEAARISKNKIIILEDTFRTPAEKLLTCCHDVLANIPLFFLRPVGKGMPFHFQSVQEWEKNFRDLGLKIISRKESQAFLVKKALFVLEK